MTDRADFFRDQLPRELDIPFVHVEPLSTAGWMAHSADRSLPLIDRVTGWTAIEVGAEAYAPEPGERPEFHIRVVFCPAVMAAATLDLPMSPAPEAGLLHIDPAVSWTSGQRRDDGSRDPAAIRFADNFLQVVAHVLLAEIAEADPVHMVELHDKLRHSAPEDLHELAPALLAEVEVRALDEHLRSLAP